MGIEIERKFLVKDDSWRRHAGEGVACRQGYLASGAVATVRVRVIGNDAFLTVKGKVEGISRANFEYAIPVADAEAMLALCDVVVEKRRYFVKHAGLTWEVDAFEGADAGLVVAEIELESESQPFEKPAWVGSEVSHDPRYFNSSLARHPFREW